MSLLKRSIPRRSRVRRFVFEEVESRSLLTSAVAGFAPAPTDVGFPMTPGQMGPMVPLPELQTTYQGLDGGLYGGGFNEPPATHASLADAALGQIQPLDAAGRPNPRGSIGLLAIGQSTTRMIFGTFQRQVENASVKNPRLRLINGAKDSQVLQHWASSAAPWSHAAAKVSESGLTARQIQVVWIEVAAIRAWRYGDLTARLAKISSDITSVVNEIQQRYPNVQTVFLTSRPYGGYALRRVDPEPYAYESGFSVRLAIQQQIAGFPALNADPSKGKREAPVLLWGPYYWANATTPSRTGLTWEPSDFSDGVHPSASGRAKAASVLLNFFTTNARTKSWFLR